MSTPMLPADGSYIEMTSYGETLSDVRVVHTGEEVITLSLALSDVPPPGSTVTVRWAANARGRYSVAADVAAIDGNRINIRFTGEPSIQQTRDFVRGGGGEPIVMERDGAEDATGWVHDLSERAVRAHFTDVVVRPGDDMRLRVRLSDDVVAFRARAFKVSSMRQQVPRRGPLSVEMVAVFESDDDRSAKLIRRYIMKQQLLARTRTAMA